MNRTKKTDRTAKANNGKFKLSYLLVFTLYLLCFRLVCPVGHVRPDYFCFSLNLKQAAGVKQISAKSSAFPPHNPSANPSGY